MSLTKSISQFVDDTLIDLARSFRFSYLPPLMIYVAAGISGLTGIVGVFLLNKFTNTNDRRYGSCWKIKVNADKTKLTNIIF